MDKVQFQNRTKLLAIRVIKMVNALSNNPAADVISRQIIRSASSIGANYRAACRAKSTADMIHKLKIVEEETDETQFWLELLAESDLMPASRLHELIKETNETLAMTVTSINTLRNHQSSI